jgi:hypothetical protein
VHELAHGHAALGLDGVHTPPQRLDRLGPPDLQDVAAPGRGLRRDDGAATDQHGCAAGRQASPVLGVACHGQPILHQPTGVRGGDEPVAKRDGPDGERRGESFVH